MKRRAGGWWRCRLRSFTISALGYYVSKFIPTLDHIAAHQVEVKPTLFEEEMKGIGIDPAKCARNASVARLSRARTSNLIFGQRRDLMSDSSNTS